MKLVSSFIAVGFGLVGCASSQVAPDKIAAPKAEIAAAEEAGAKEHPTAALHLQMANDQYDRAKRLIKGGDGDEAELVLARARVDAQYALELARLEQTKQQASDALEKIDQLKREHRLIRAE